MVRGPVEVQAACGAALVELSGAFATTTVAGSLEQWAAVVGSLQRVIDVASAAQDAAIARLAAIEPEFLEDGTVVQCHRGLGHVALDAPAIVSGVLATSAVHAQRRVRTAARLAADGPAGSETATGLGGLHAAMSAGRLDGYRAAVVAEELEHAPAEVAATVVAALEGHFETEDGTAPAAAVPAGADPDQPGPAAPARRQGPRAVRAAAVGRRAGGGPVGGHLPLRGGRPGVGRDRRPGPPVRHRRRLLGHRTRPGEGVDRPGRRQRHHRHDHHRHRPSRRRPGAAVPSTLSPSPLSRHRRPGGRFGRRARHQDRHGCQARRRRR